MFKRVVLHDTDFIAALLKRCCNYNKVPWCGRAFVLQDAYRQLAIAPAHRAHSFICVYEPTHGPRCYRMLTMPFGSSASVYAFLRTSLAIHALGTRLFHLPYDDFPTVVPEPLANAATHLIKSLFTLLGFQVSGKPSKNPPFAAVFQALGVAFNLTRAVSGVFEVANTEARIQLLASSLQELLTSHSLSPKEARRLRGRMQFAHGQLSGRYHSQCLIFALSALAPGSQAPPSLVRILQRCLQSLVHSMPRAVSSKDRLVWHIFTDGALEASKPSIGGVLVDFFGQPRFHFSFAPPVFQFCILQARPALRHGHFLSCGQRSCASFSCSHVLRQPCGRPACPTLPTP